MTSRSRFALCVCALAAGATSASAQDAGDPVTFARLRPDETFGRKGDLPSTPPLARIDRVAIDGAGRVVLAGGVAFKSSPDGPGITRWAVRVARLLPDGTPDESFGVHGIAAPPVAYVDLPEQWLPLELAIDGKDRVVVAGGLFAFDGGFAAATRLTSSGTLDLAFAGDGVLSLPPADRVLRVVHGFHLDRADDAMVFVASNNGHLDLVRIKADGTPDEAFGTDGVAYAGQDRLRDLEIDSKGRVLALEDLGDGAFVVRYGRDGTRDQALGPNGRLALTAQESVRAEAMEVDSLDRIVLFARTATPRSFQLFRYLPDGTLDRSFGPGGGMAVQFGGPAGVRWDDVSALETARDQPDRIVVAGTATTPAGVFAFVQKIDAARPSKVESFLRRIPGARRVPEVRAVAVADDGRTATVVGDVQSTRRGATSFATLATRVLLDGPIQLPTADHRLQWEGAPRLSYGDPVVGPTNFSGAIRAFDRGRPTPIRSDVRLYLSEDAQIDHEDRLLGIVPAQAFRGRRSGARSFTLSLDFGPQGWEGRRLIAVIDDWGPDAAPSNDVAVSEPLE